MSDSTTNDRGGGNGRSDRVNDAGVMTIGTAREPIMAADSAFLMTIQNNRPAENGSRLALSIAHRVAGQRFRTRSQEEGVGGGGREGGEGKRQVQLKQRQEGPLLPLPLLPPPPLPPQIVFSVPAATAPEGAARALQLT